MSERRTDLRSALIELIENHWINLENSTDRFLAINYGLVVTVDDLRDLLADHPPAQVAPPPTLFGED